MFALVAQVTDRRPSARGELEGKPAIFSEPLRVMSLSALGHARRLHVLDAGVEVLDVLAHDDEVDAAAANTASVTPGSSRTGRMLRRSRRACAG